MKNEYDFSKGKRGPVVAISRGKARITIRLDEDVLHWFREQVHAAGGGSYQNLINAALREHIAARKETLETTLRRVLREELPKRRAAR
jgi:uncharacterized protein (DUF4415 family)